jgi:rod shape-determining protein MreC
MPVQLWRFRQYITLGLCVVISIALMVTAESERVESARRVRSVVFYPLEKTLQLRDRYRGLAEDNRALRLRVTRLVQENSRLQDAKAENERLRGMLGFKERGYADMVPAEVIGWDESAIGLNLEIDQGAGSGVQEGHPVVSVDGLVGKIVQVSARTSWVMTLRSPECAVSAMDQRSRVRGIVRWRYPGGLALQLVPIGSDVTEGDMILSSGLGGVYPKGLRIGIVKAVEERIGDLFRTVMLEPVADFDRLEEVAVLTGQMAVDSGSTAGLEDAMPGGHSPGVPEESASRDPESAPSPREE